jgi:hypothetical protein
VEDSSVRVCTSCFSALPQLADQRGQAAAAAAARRSSRRQQCHDQPHEKKDHCCRAFLELLLLHCSTAVWFVWCPRHSWAVVASVACGSACLFVVFPDPARADDIFEVDIHPTVTIVEMTIVRLT